MSTSAYERDLAWIHDAGFGDFARDSTPGLLDILAERGIANGRIVELGCGSGICAELLIDAGHKVLGIDISPAMIALARRRAPRARFRVDSCFTADLPDCDAVIAMGEVLNYCFDRRNRLANLARLFRRVHKALRPGGLFLFDLAGPGRNSDRTRSFREGNGWSCQVEFQHDARRERLTRRIVTFRRSGRLYRRCEENHTQQLYRPSAIAARLREAGFRVRTRRRFGEFELPRHCTGFIARRP